MDLLEIANDLISQMPHDLGLLMSKLPLFSCLSIVRKPIANGFNF